MRQIVLFHSVLGVSHGVRDAADRFRAAGHAVRVVDDPFRDQDFVGRLSTSIRQAGAHLETYDYPVTCSPTSPYPRSTNPTTQPCCGGGCWPSAPSVPAST